MFVRIDMFGSVLAASYGQLLHWEVTRRDDIISIPYIQRGSPSCKDSIRVT